MYRRVVLTVALVHAGCHVITQTEITRPGETRRVTHPEGAIARRPTLVLTDAGALRFVEPLECPTEEHVTSVTSIEVATEPNVATFVVGVIATAVGGLMLTNGVADGASKSPYTYGGLGSVAVGLPLAIGPWLGTRTEVRPGPEAKLTRPGPSEPCGERGLAARTATLTIRGVEVHGRVDRDGTFAISPYQLVDAYDPKAISAWDITAVVDTEGGVRTVAVVLDAGALASHAADFLEHADFDAKIQPLRLVPNVVPGILRVSLTSTSDGPALRLVLPLKNDGPGEAFALRGQITSSTKAIDGRVIYIGHLAKSASTTRELLIPLTAAAADTIRGTAIEVSVELRDAYGTAPATPIRFRGAVLGDAPR
jgi:hypothetical protein